MQSRGKGTVRQTMMGAQRTKAGNGLSTPISHHHLYPYLLLAVGSHAEAQPAVVELLASSSTEQPFLYHLFQEVFPDCCVRKWAKHTGLELHIRKDLFPCLNPVSQVRNPGLNEVQWSEASIQTQVFVHKALPRCTARGVQWRRGWGGGEAVLSKHFLLKCHLFNYF